MPDKAKAMMQVYIGISGRKLLQVRLSLVLYMMYIYKLLQLLMVLNGSTEVVVVVLLLGNGLDG